jgi:hypothetical protein
MPVACRRPIAGDNECHVRDALVLGGVPRSALARAIRLTDAHGPRSLVNRAPTTPGRTSLRGRRVWWPPLSAGPCDTVAAGLQPAGKDHSHYSQSKETSTLRTLTRLKYSE